MTQTNTMNSESNNSWPKIGILGASFATNNYGVTALGSGTVASICHSFPKARIYFLDYEKEAANYQVTHADGITTVELINLRFSKQFYLRNNIAYLLFLVLSARMLPSRKWRARFLRRNHVLKNIQEADIIGSIAGGDSFSDIYGIGRLIYVALPQILVLLLGKPLIVLPQTLGPFKSLFAKAIARYILNRAQIVYSRDKESLSLVRGLLGGDNKKLEFGYDMGFALDPFIRDERIPLCFVENDDVSPLIGLNISGLLYMGGYTQNNMFGLKVDYRQLIHEIIGYFVKKHNARIVLVPHVFGVDEESDLIATQRIYEATGHRLRSHLRSIEEGYDQRELKAIIGKCGFFIGSRMHACIAAFSQCVPAVGLAYSQKFRGVFESIGMEELVIHLCEHNEKAIIPLLDRLYERRKDLRAKLEAKIPVVRKSVLQLFNGALVTEYGRRSL